MNVPTLEPNLGTEVTSDKRGFLISALFQNTTRSLGDGVHVERWGLASQVPAEGDPPKTGNRTAGRSTYHYSSNDVFSACIVI